MEKITIHKFAKIIGVSYAAVREAIEQGRLYDSIEITKTKNGKRKRTLIDQKLAEKEWLENTTVNSKNEKLYQNLQNRNKEVKNKDDKIKPKNQSAVTYVDEFSNFNFPLITESKKRSAFFESEIKRLKVKKESQDLLPYDAVYKLLSNLIARLQKEIRLTYTKVKMETSPEIENIVKNIIDPVLANISNLQKRDFDNV